MASSTISVRAASSIGEVDPTAWDGLLHGPSPFLRHGFLQALEDSGSIDGATRGSLISTLRRSYSTSPALSRWNALSAKTSGQTS